MNVAQAGKIFHSVGATLLAVTFLCLGALAADAYEIPFINGWALAHGTIFFMFPAYFVLSHFLLLPSARRFQHAEGNGLTPTVQISFWGIASLLFSGSGFLVPIVGSALGVLTGHVARYRCRTTPNLDGSGFAVAGLILGYVGLAYQAYVFGTVWWVSTQHIG